MAGFFNHASPSPSTASVENEEMMEQSSQENDTMNSFAMDTPSKTTNCRDSIAPFFKPVSYKSTRQYVPSPLRQSFTVPISEETKENKDKSYRKRDSIAAFFKSPADSRRTSSFSDSSRRISSISQIDHKLNLDECSGGIQGHYILINRASTTFIHDFFKGFYTNKKSTR